MRAIGLDVHLEFCEVAISEQGKVRSAGRIATKPDEVELFAQSLGSEDRVALEVTGNAWEIKRILDPHVAEVIVASPTDTGIRGARAKTDRLDARTLARLLASGELEAVWMPDRRTQVMRRRLQRRNQLIWGRSKAKNQIHATLMRQLIGRPPHADLFGKRGRQWLAEFELALEERESVDSALRQIEFLDGEVEAVERLIATDALKSPEIKRLMTVPGVNVICAATFMAAIGEVRRFESPRKLVGYLGLDPRVHQSGSTPPSHGRISKQGSGAVRHALVEASWSVIRQPGPIRAFYQRVRSRRGHQVAITAAARKLACLFWCLLTREEDYAFGQPSLTQKKLRLLEVRAGSPGHKGVYTGTFVTRQRMRAAERELAEQAETAYRRSVRDWHATQAKRKATGAGATPGRASRGPSSGQAARQDKAPSPAL
jgi:transposase